MTAELEKPSAAEVTDLQEALEMVRSFSVETADDVAFAEQSRAQAKEQWAHYEGKRTAITKHMNAALKQVNDDYRPVLTCLKSIMDEWSRKIVAKKQEEAAAQAALLAAAQKAEAPEEIRTALVAAAQVPTETRGHLRDRWVWKVADADAIPREFLMPDGGKIDALVKVQGAATQIPGIEVKNEPYYVGGRS